MFSGIFNLLLTIINGLTYYTVKLMSDVFQSYQINGLDLFDYDINLTLFSDTPILSADFHTFLVMFFTVFYSMFLIVLLYKVTKKFISMIFGVFKV